MYAEIGTDGGALLYSFDPPGLVARGDSLTAALAGATAGHAELCDIEGSAVPDGRVEPDHKSHPSGFNFVVAEEYRRRGKVANGNTSATFKPDLVPLSRAEVDHYLKLLAESRRRLLLLRPLIDDAPDPAARLDFHPAPKRMSIRRQLQHIASCERWYLTKVWPGLGRLARAPDVWARLATVRDLVVRTFQAQPEASLALVREVNGEVWTPRKVVRRLMYHEKFHRDTLGRDLRGAFEGGG